MTRQGPPAAPTEWAAALIIVALATVLVPAWAAVELAGLAHTGAWPHIGIGALAVGVGALPHHLTDPARAFPARTRRQLPGPSVFYAALTVVLTSCAITGAVTAKAARRVRGGGHGYAATADVRTYLSSAAVRARGRQTRPALTGRVRAAQVGLSLGRDETSGQQLWGSIEDSYLYLGPPRSGKGVHLVISQTLDAPGAVVVTATRPDTLHHTITMRSRQGPVVVFDPQCLAGDVPRLRWTPQRGCEDPLTAITRARALAAGAQFMTGTTNGEFWQTMTEAVIRCYLHAAAISERPVAELLRWSARPTDPTPMRVLRSSPDAVPGWADELASQVSADPHQRDSVWAGVRRAVDSLADPRVVDACSPGPGDAFDPDRFLREGGTMYLLGSTGVQLSVAPLITALVEDLLDTARRQGATSRGGRMDPPLLLLLDEAANIAPLPSLPNLLSDGGGVGITTVAVLQSLAQARNRWGEPGAAALWDAATTKVILGGIADADDLSKISRLAGDIDDVSTTYSNGPGGPSTATSVRRLPALPVETLRCLPPGRAIVLARHTPPVRARLTPWWKRVDAADIRASAGAQ